MTEIGVGGGGIGEVNKDEKIKSRKRKNSEMAKYKNIVKTKNHNFSFDSKNIKTFNRSNFFQVKARLLYIKLRQVFIKTPIFGHFDLKC